MHPSPPPTPPRGDAPPALAELAGRVLDDLRRLSAALDLAGTGDLRTIRAVNEVYVLAHHHADDQIHHGWRERGVCRYCGEDRP
ncbi:MAG: hypothetical protein ACRD2C_10240 [Acidimicrobiales bacterium]